MLRPIGLHRQRSTGINEAAKYVVANYGGTLPVDYGDLIRIPHVGPYTAGAIMSFGYGMPVPVLDSNVRRVITRAFRETFGDKVSDKEILRVLKNIIPEDSPKLFNWSLIDIGAILCSYRYVKCIECPLERICDYNTQV